MKKSIALLLIFMFATLGAFADNCIKEQKYRGKVGSYPIVMYLEMYESGKVTGYYYYVKKGQTNPAYLYLNGKCRASRNGYDDEVYFNIKLTEKDSKGKVSGTWDITEDFYDSTIWGKFKTSKGKVYNVDLSGY